MPGKSLVALRIEDDDPDGFRDLTHAYTLYAESSRKADPAKRGRFNLGEKLMLAVCDQACITSTTGTIVFDSRGRRASQACREVGTLVEATLRMTRAELSEVLAAAQLLIPPEGVSTTINGRLLQRPDAVGRFEATLPTELTDNQGVLRRTERKTWVSAYAPSASGAWLYELGVPVVEIDSPWSLDVGQKVPINSDRDNVTPSYLRRVATAALNAMHARLDAHDAARSLVQAALASPDVAPEAVRSVLDEQHGPYRVVYDPSDLEANSRAASRGYTVLHGRAYSAEQWQQIRAASAAPPAGRVFPSPKAYSPDGDPEHTIPIDQWTAGMRRIAHYYATLGQVLRANPVRVVLVREPAVFWLANYGRGRLCLNVSRLGDAFFDDPNWLRIDSLLIHELAHEAESDHLSSGYHEALCDLGARLARLALEQPQTILGARGGS